MILKTRFGTFDLPKDDCVACIHTNRYMSCSVCELKKGLIEDTAEPFHARQRMIEEGTKDRREELGYTLQHPGNDCCMNCEHPFCGPTGLHCDVVGADVFKGDTCRKFKMRHGHTPGILKIPEVTDADKEAIRQVMATNSTAIPIVQVHPMKETYRDIATILAWLYSKGVLWHGRDEQIEKLLRNVVKEGEE